MQAKQQLQRVVQGNSIQYKATVTWVNGGAMENDPCDLSLLNQVDRDMSDEVHTKPMDLAEFFLVDSLSDHLGVQ